MDDYCCFSAVYMYSKSNPTVCTIQVHTLSEGTNQEPRQLTHWLMHFFPQSIIMIAHFKSAQTDCWSQRAAIGSWDAVVSPPVVSYPRPHPLTRKRVWLCRIRNLDFWISVYLYDVAQFHWLASMLVWHCTISLACSESRPLTWNNQESAQLSPDDFPRNRVGSGHETTPLGAHRRYQR